MPGIMEWLFGAAGEAPRISTLSPRPDVLALNVTAQALVALGLFAIALGILWLARRREGFLSQRRLAVLLFAALAFLCGVVFVIGIFALWYPLYGLEALAIAAAAVAAVAAVAAARPHLAALARPSAAQLLAEANKSLRREVAAHEATLRELEAAHRELESRVNERTAELSVVKARFETALRGARVHLYSQDRDLHRTWAYSPDGESVFPAADSDAVVALKRRVLETGVPADTEAAYAAPDGRVQFSLHVDPTFGLDGEVDGIMCAAIEVTRMRSLESEQQRLTAELATAVQRYETALHGSNVTVFTQDRELRYTSISNPMLGRTVDEIVGRRDEDIIPAENRAPIETMKRAVIESGRARDGEVRISRDGSACWYDLHIEPLRDVAGAIVGLTCAAVDVTERKEAEAQLRLLLRELTHRSKNLLAVIQAMARQTARHSGTTDAFLDMFNARLQALARSHDLLVQEGWQGAALEELVRSQLGHYLDREKSRIAIKGPAVWLRPEAAQSLGLALHELAANAAKYGALSVPQGRLSIEWTRRAPSEGFGLDILWTESGGPAVAAPDRRGFGSLIIERNLARSLEADVELTFAADGVRCRIGIPLAQLYGAQ